MGVLSHRVLSVSWNWPLRGNGTQWILIYSWNRLGSCNVAVCKCLEDRPEQAISSLQGLNRFEFHFHFSHPVLCLTNNTGPWIWTFCTIDRNYLSALSQSCFYSRRVHSTHFEALQGPPTVSLSFLPAPYAYNVRMALSKHGFPAYKISFADRKHSAHLQLCS